MQTVNQSFTLAKQFRIKYKSTIFQRIILHKKTYSIICGGKGGNVAKILLLIQKNSLRPLDADKMIKLT